MRCEIPPPSIQDLEEARRVFEENEPRDLFYRAATELVALALRQDTSLTLAEALAVLLQTWNSSYYRFHGKFDDRHFRNLERVLDQHKEDLARLRERDLEGLTTKDEESIRAIFSDFESVLGPVGAAKGLHLLAPRVFPIWDRKIAQAYGLGLKKAGTNAGQYLRFMSITREQCKALGGQRASGRNLLKALDEYNYCRLSRKWL